MRCVAHPDVVTPRSCALCAQPRCDACLAPSPLGPVCPTCLPVASQPEPPPPPPRLTFGRALRAVGELGYWGLVAFPLVAGTVSALDLRRTQEVLAFLHEEPIRLGDVARDLTDLAARAEAAQREDGEAWDGEAWMDEVLRSRDPYAIDASPYLVVPDPAGMRLCSVGPDRVNDGGVALGRFSGEGDVCILLRSPAMLQVR